MAVDKLVDSTQLNTDLTDVANAIRTKGGTSAQLAFPGGFVSAVQAIPTGITPTGTKQISITENGTVTEDVTNYASAEITVDVQGGGAPRIAMTGADTAPTLDSNKLYVFPEMSALTITLATPSDNTIVNEYHFIFDSGATATVLTLPASVLQPDGFTVEANMRYEISILEGCMTAQGWAVSL